MTIASLVLTQLGRQQRIMAEQLKRQEVLNVATMAVQTGQSSLELNSVSVQVIRDQQQVTVYSEGKEVMSLAKE